MQVYGHSNNSIKTQVFHVGYCVVFPQLNRGKFISRIKNLNKSFNVSLIKGLKIKKIKKSNLKTIQEYKPLKKQNSSQEKSSNIPIVALLLVVPLVYILIRYFKKKNIISIISILVLSLLSMNLMYSDVNVDIEKMYKEISKNPKHFKSYKKENFRIPNFIGRPDLDNYYPKRRIKYRFEEYRFLYPELATKILAYAFIMPAAEAFYWDRRKGSLVKINLWSLKQYIHLPIDKENFPLYFNYAREFFMYDGWGTMFKLEVIEKKYDNQILIISAGPDRKFNTSDDIILKEPLWLTFMTKLNLKSFLILEMKTHKNYYSYIETKHHLLEFLLLKPRLNIKKFWKPIIIPNGKVYYTDYRYVFYSLYKIFIKNKAKKTKSDFILCVNK